jgi:urease accessory protein
MLVTLIPIHWLAIAILSVIFGMFQGYSDATSIIGAAIPTAITFVISVAFSQTVIVMSARKIGVIFGMNEINQILPKIIRFVGLVFCAIGIVFLSYSII